jgi:hypothetical protein
MLSRGDDVDDDLVTVPLDGLRRLFDAARIGMALVFGEKPPADAELNYPFDWIEDDLMQRLKPSPLVTVVNVNHPGDVELLKRQIDLKRRMGSF